MNFDIFIFLSMTIISNIHHHLIKTYTEPIHAISTRTMPLDGQDNSAEMSKLGLEKIDREVLLIKICNAQLPTATTLQKQKW